jgi:hypothetical protein
METPPKTLIVEGGHSSGGSLRYSTFLLWNSVDPSFEIGHRLDDLIELRNSAEYHPRMAV